MTYEEWKIWFGTDCNGLHEFSETEATIAHAAWEFCESQTKKAATAAEQNRWIAIVNRYNPRYALAILHEAIPQGDDKTDDDPR